MDDEFELPKKIARSSSSPATSLCLSQRHYALRGSCPRALADRGVSILGDGSEFHLFEGRPESGLASSESLHPVYVDAAGAPFLPTGRVFIRLAEGQDIRERIDAIQQAGFELDSQLRRAPHAAWLVSSSGSLAHALEGFSRLAQIEGVENVELQLLAPAARR